MGMGMGIGERERVSLVGSEAVEMIFPGLGARYDHRSGPGCRSSRMGQPPRPPVLV